MPQPSEPISSRSDHRLAADSRAFDHQIDERIENGHVPDLRRAVACDWFRNNSWRRPAYVELDFGEQFRLIRDAIERHCDTEGRPVRILEVGCGPGYLSLELARSGFDVTGLDLSLRCVEVARRIAEEDPWRAARGPLCYVAGDLFGEPTFSDASFDAVVFLGALHHFPDTQGALARVSGLLAPGGIVVVHEPVRDRVTHGSAAFVHLLRVVLAAGGGFHASRPPPSDRATLDREIAEVFDELRYESEGGGNVQSINDNEAGYAQMRPALDARFAELVFEWRYAFFHEHIGGLRFDEQANARLAWYLREMDRVLCSNGVLQATEFFYVGRKAREHSDA